MHLKTSEQDEKIVALMHFIIIRLVEEMFQIWLTDVQA